MIDQTNARHCELHRRVLCQIRVRSCLDEPTDTLSKRAETPAYQGFLAVGDTGIEPVTSAV
jgi:hypothetical protein